MRAGSSSRETLFFFLSSFLLSIFISPPSPFLLLFPKIFLWILSLITRFISLILHLESQLVYSKYGCKISLKLLYFINLFIYLFLSYCKDLLTTDMHPCIVSFYFFFCENSINIFNKKKM